jgi:hypothetical protein
MTRFLLTASLIILFTIPCLADEAENMAVVGNMISAANARDLDGLGNYVAKNIVRHSVATPGVDVTDIDEFRYFIQAEFATTPD